MDRAEKIAAVLVIVSFVLYAGILGVPFLAEGTTSRIAISGGLVLAGEGAFWLGALVAGRAVMKRYRSKLLPRNWRRRQASDQTDSGRAP